MTLRSSPQGIHTERTVIKFSVCSVLADIRCYLKISRSNSLPTIRSNAAVKFPQFPTIFTDVFPIDLNAESFLYRLYRAVFTS